MIWPQFTPLTSFPSPSFPIPPSSQHMQDTPLNGLGSPPPSYTRHMQYAKLHTSYSESHAHPAVLKICWVRFCDWAIKLYIGGTLLVSLIHSPPETKCSHTGCTYSQLVVFSNNWLGLAIPYLLQNLKNAQTCGPGLRNSKVKTGNHLKAWTWLSGWNQ